MRRLDCSDVDKVEPAEYLWKAGDDRAIAGRVVIQFEQGSCNKFVVSGYREESFLGQLNKEQPLVLLGACAVCRDVGILRSFKIWSPPVGNHILH